MRNPSRWLGPLTAALLLAVAGQATLAQEEPPPAAPDAAVAIVDSDYQPGTITVAPGTRVVWTNTGELRHDAVSLTGLWRSGRLDRASPSVASSMRKALSPTSARSTGRWPAR